VNFRVYCWLLKKYCLKEWKKLIILDEIDAGIGGKTADYVAQFIYQLAQHHRIICITHLAQIAAICQSTAGFAESAR
jgi:DNA repair ATPase RecN